MHRSIYFRGGVVADPCPGTPGPTIPTIGMINNDHKFKCILNLLAHFKPIHTDVCFLPLNRSLLLNETERNNAHCCWPLNFECTQISYNNVTMVKVN